MAPVLVPSRQAPPPTTTTRPSGRRVAVDLDRGWMSAPAESDAPVVGSETRHGPPSVDDEDAAVGNIVPFVGGPAAPRSVGLNDIVSGSQISRPRCRRYRPNDQDPTVPQQGRGVTFALRAQHARRG